MNISVDFAARNPPKRYTCALYDNNDLSSNMKQGNCRYPIQSSPESVEPVIYNPVQSKSIWIGLDFKSGGLIQSISYSASYAPSWGGGGGA